MASPYTKDELDEMLKSELFEAACELVDLLDKAPFEEPQQADHFVEFLRGGPVPGGYVLPGYVYRNASDEVLFAIPHRKISAEQYEAAFEDRKADLWA